jgi:iron complex outermembrane receptor protein
MTGGIRQTLLATSAFIGILNATPALAQGTIDTGEIIVTAQRVEQRLQDVPISITVMDTRQLSNRNITIANDLATYTPSLSSNERYGPEKSSFSLRGFNQDNNTAPTVGVYFAEVVGVRAQGGTTSGNSVGAGAFMDLANVQILKGPQGTLFGRNTTGGAILLTPKKPTGQFEGFIEGSLGNYDMKRVQGAVNIPVNDSLRIRLSGDRMTRDGYLINKSGIGPRDLNDRDYYALRLSVVADLTPNLENYTIVQYSKSQTSGFSSRIVGYDPSRGAGSAGLTGSGAAIQLARQNARGDSFYDIESAVLDPYSHIEQWQIINTTTWRATDNITIKNIASYGEFREKGNFDLYASNFQTGPAGYAGLGFLIPANTRYKYIELDGQPGQSLAAQSTATEELQLQGTLGDGKLVYAIGGYLEFSRPLGLSAGRTGIFLNCTDVQNLVCANPLNIGSISESRTKMDFDNHGIYAQATYKITDQLALTGGIRYTIDTQRGTTLSTRASLATAATPGATLDPTGAYITRQCTDTFRHNIGVIQDLNQCRTDIRNRSTAPTWVINLEYKPTEDVLLYGKWSRGYRQGGINFTNPGLETWNPEKLNSYEVGAKTSFHGTVSGYLNLAGFYNKLTDSQVFAGLISGTPSVAGGAAIVNAGKARSYGVEVDGSITFFNSLRFDAGYAYLNTKIESLASQAELLPLLVGTPFIGINPTAFTGTPFTLSPKHKLNLTGTYTLPLPEKVGRLSVSGTLLYQSSQIANGGMPASCGPTKTTDTTVPTAPGSAVSSSWCFAPNTVPLGVLPGRTLVNLNVNWDNIGGMPIDGAFFVTNLTKKTYFVNTGGGFTSAAFGDVQVGEPRTWGFRLKYRFGA